MEEINMLSGSKIKGRTIHTADKKQVGKVLDIMIDSKSGVIAYAVVHLPKIDGLEERFCAVPWEALIQKDDGSFLIDMDDSRIREAPSFEKDKLPYTHATSYIARIHAHYGFEPYWQREFSHHH